MLVVLPLLGFSSLARHAVSSAFVAVTTFSVSIKSAMLFERKEDRIERKKEAKNP